MLDKLKDVMKERGIKAFTLAKKSDINISDMYAALNGKRPMYPNWKKRIAEALEMKESELFDESTDSKAREKEAENEK